MRFVFYLEERFLRRVTSMFLAFGKAINLKLSHWEGTVTAMFKAKFLESNCTMNMEVGKKA